MPRELVFGLLWFQEWVAQALFIDFAGSGFGQLI
jgi:hypothetical protein